MRKESTSDYYKTVAKNDVVPTLTVSWLIILHGLQCVLVADEGFQRKVKLLVFRGFWYGLLHTLKKKKKHSFIYTSLNLHGNLGGEEIAYEASWLVWEIFQTECPFCSSELEGVCCNCAECQKSRQKLPVSFASLNTQPSWQESAAGFHVGCVSLWGQPQRSVLHGMMSSCEFSDARADIFFPGAGIWCAEQLMGSVVGILQAASSPWKRAHFTSGNESQSRQCCLLKRLTSQTS